VAAGVAAGVEAAVGAAESAVADFFELRDFFVGVESVETFASAAGVAAEASVASFFDAADFFLEVVEAELSADGEAASASDFFERLLAFGCAEASAEVVALESAVAESDFLDFVLEFDFVLESGVAADWVESSVAAFFFDLDFGFGVLVSV